PTPGPSPSPSPLTQFEGDINASGPGIPLGWGDGGVTIADTIIYGRVLRGEICPGAANPPFQQKLDAGPRSSLGDGLFGPSDGSAIDAYARHDSSTDFNPATPAWDPTPAGGQSTITNLLCKEGGEDQPAMMGRIETGS